EGGREVILVEECLHESRPRPRYGGGLRVGRQKGAIGADGIRGLAGGTAPPSEAQQGILRQGLRAAGGERLEPRDSAFFVPEAAERIPEPERRLAGERARRIRRQERDPLVARFHIALEPVEGERAP